MEPNQNLVVMCTGTGVGDMCDDSCDDEDETDDGAADDNVPDRR